VITEIEILGGSYNDTTKVKLFIKGLHPRFRRVQEKLLDDLEIYDKPITEIAQIAGNFWQTQRSFADTLRIPGYRSDGDKKVVAGLKDLSTKKVRFSKDGDWKSKVVCYNCGQTGHIKKDCKNEAVQNVNIDNT
jgi:Zinc knuckle